MKKKRILFLFVTMFASTLLYSQVVGIKTNVVTDAMKIINLGAEIGLSKKLTLDLYANYNPWKYKDQKMMKMLAFQPELRYWFCDKFNGHFVGFHVHGGVYQAAAIEMPWGIWPELEDHRFKGNFYGAGLSYGYQWILGKHWNLEGNIGVGYARVKYEQFECMTCGAKVSEGHKNYVGPTKAAVSLIYLF
ncbi:MAG: DUF3575 domain-containing protein [Bacteroides xylanisolvens]|jgi:hypothetical protein|uniref:DUF3575 domain-containing protein n=1 Tax=Bacteroides xylanisolvens TaxID=371601 RepID=UPI00374F5E5E